MLAYNGSVQEQFVLQNLLFPMLISIEGKTGRFSSTSYSWLGHWITQKRPQLDYIYMSSVNLSPMVASTRGLIYVRWLAQIRTPGLKFRHALPGWGGLPARPPQPLLPRQLELYFIRLSLIRSDLVFGDLVPADGWVNPTCRSSWWREIQWYLIICLWYLV